MMDLFSGQELTAIDAALTEMAELYGVTYEDLQGRNREAELVGARRFVARRLYREGLRVGQIATLLSRRHETILNLLHNEGWIA